MFAAAGDDNAPVASPPEAEETDVKLASELAALAAPPPDRRAVGGV